MITPTIILLLKAPRPGEVKTRLATTVGSPMAVIIYRQMVGKLLNDIPKDWPIQIHFTPANATQQIHEWLAPFDRSSLTYHIQPTGDLGVRLATAYSHAFSQGSGSVIALGGDCPALDTASLIIAATHLTSHDAVIGPAEDGGYYLLGLQHPQPSLFTAMSWSTPAVLDETRSRLNQLNLRTIELPPLYDVDVEADWQRAVAAGWLHPMPNVNNR